MTYIVMTSTGQMPSSCRGTYRNVAIVKLTPDYAREGLVPKMISNRAKGVAEITCYWGPLNVGKTAKAAYQSQLAMAEWMAAKWNSEEEEAAA